MRSNAGMASRQGDVDLRFAQVDVPLLTLWLGLAGPSKGCRGFSRCFHVNILTVPPNIVTDRFSIVVS